MTRMDRIYLYASLPLVTTKMYFTFDIIKWEGQNLKNDDGIFERNSLFL